MNRTVIVHEEMGIFVGAAAGMAFWSMLDAGGQWRCASFDGEGDAREFVGEWDPPQDPNHYRYVSVESASEFITVGDLDKAGLASFTALLLFNLPVEGNS